MDAHMLNKNLAQEDVRIVILQYLWEQFRDTVDPYSSHSARSCRQRWPLFKYIAEIRHVI